jgi:hypothetical protein
MPRSDTFYLCPTCFVATTQDVYCHEHRMITVSTLSLDAEQRRPLSDSGGRLLTQAPRWFVALTHPVTAGQVR